ncbi:MULTISPECIES: SRPBCC family protein [unclassified Sinorhizobium]|uniref:SRPBCC family protein n=1 Tax=unclassified Sinorhizobium TaxID=2613772 RepID=UPI0024C33ABD|nr:MULTISPECIES: SRPBCC family protein [unclassified Sinorhizobium]MDK1373734.1 SRPBCC family protein [Sinorhizobium sp. 6-70]MDK1478765.1 SRPBCC family protein [Sinorhizobium sp. 6-117]
MPSTEFNLVTEWTIDASVEDVWRVLNAPETWPEWWPSVKEVTLLREGDEDGIGAVHRMKWSTALPYDLSFEIETIRIVPLSIIEGRARGELEGIGRWTLQPEGSKCNVRYDWIVRVTKPWMIRLSFVLKPVFGWNHAVVMERGRRGLMRRLARDI